MTPELTAGLDLGTSGLKGVVVDAAGTVVAVAEAAYPTSRPSPGAAEQDPADWERAVRSVLARLAEATTSGAWAGIGLSAMIPTLVLLDGEDRPLGNAITWEDARAEDDGRAFRERIGGDDLYRRTGQWVDGRYLLPMFVRVRREDSGPSAATATVASAKDYLHATLTGRVATDPSTATGFGCFDLTAATWDEELLADVLGGAPDAKRVRLPDVDDPAATTGLCPHLAREVGLPPGLPVSLGAADSVCAAFGMGARRAGDVAIVAGTSVVIVGVQDRPWLDPGHRYLLTPLVGGGWGLEMDLVSAGSAVAWLASLLGPADEAAVLEMAAGTDAGARGVSFLPFLGPGEQGALWDPSLRGTLAGLTLSHEPSDIARALLEGIVLEVRRCLDVLPGTASGAGDVTVAGWAAADPVPALLADATGRRIRPQIQSEGGSVSAVGAALLAGGVDPGREPAGGVETRHPTTAGVERWDGLWSRHERLLGAVRAAGHVDEEETIR